MLARLTCGEEAYVKMKKPCVRTATSTRDQRGSVSRHQPTPQGPQAGPSVDSKLPPMKPWYVASDRSFPDFKKFAYKWCFCLLKP